jgi:hypothetical protein
MSAQLPEIQGVSIVLLGDFNPKIFQPAWFAAQGLIRQQEAEEAQIAIVHQDVVSFNLEWLRLQVTQERFAMTTTQEPYYVVMRDLIVGTFRLLPHTPLYKLGINSNMHFRMNSEETWNSFGDQLAPKELWQDLLKKPGMRSLIMEGQRPDEIKGYIRVQVEPSVKVHPGVYFEVNDHYEVETLRPGMGSDEIVSIFERTWGESLTRSKKIISTLLERKL